MGLGYLLVLLLLVVFKCVYLDICFDVWFDNCVFDLIGEDVDVVLCIVLNLLELFVVMLFDEVDWVLCVVLDYLVVYGVLKIFDVLGKYIIVSVFVVG